ncbi:DNA sulfur modification protein DndB [Phosphitispora sp. TUW77]|uniref:DNA sulfur modification protein DndB n=1 Tax=Phosphitispora sp. TUW77 TaxID=3152361 RepID=UPI003AB88648
MATIGCIKAKLGSTDYYIAKMSAGQLIDSIGFAMEMPEWEEMTADEKMQRSLEVNRVVTEIVPYVIEDPDKFFGSLIIDIYSGYENIVFEPVTNIVKDLPAAYQTPMKDMGFLTLPGKERLIALDGQHRLLSLKVAIKGLMGLPAGTNIASSWKNLTPHPELADEEISVILVEHKDNMKIRKIFNKVNKYAKQTSRSDNIITSDDDIFAVISRKLLKEGEPLAPIGGIDLVNWKSNTLSKRSKQLTTLSALYTICQALLRDDKFSSKMFPVGKVVDESYQEVANFWSKALEGLDAFKEYLNLTKQDRPVSGLREENLLMKPITQMALAHVARMAKAKGVEWTEVVQKLNKIDWSFDNKLWFNILIIGSANKKMITGKDSVRSAGLVISYMVLGDLMGEDEITSVRQIVANAKDNENEPLPDVVL